MSEASRYDVVVIGSGFGGSVVASRAADAGLRVLVLERGRPYPPGSFARSPYEFAQAFWDPDRGRHGLFDIRSYRRPPLKAVTASGLGGGSLIYANVVLEKDPASFAGDGFPFEPADLAPHYARVHAMQRPEPYPFARTTAKTRALEDAARRTRSPFVLPPLAVRFRQADKDSAPETGMPLADKPWDNLHGRQRFTCTLCGECDIGCQNGAKQTLDLTYLSHAALHATQPAEIRCLCEARVVEPLGAPGGGYRVRYEQHVAARGACERDSAELLEPDRTRAYGAVEARAVVLAAGALGSTRLLLANRATLRHLSPALGTRFSTNGDLLAFVRRADRPLHPSRGPVITGAIRVTDAQSASGREYLVQDAGAPVIGDWAWHLLDLGPNAVRVVARRAFDRIRRRHDPLVGAELAGLFGEARTATNMMPLLGMGRDLPSGTIRLRGREVEVDWDVEDSDAFFDALADACRATAKALGGRSSVTRRSGLVTVHPLGGCPMAEDPRAGVVDPFGAVHGHPGLVVADGSVLPGPVGANPSATIAAVADRCADRLIERLAA